MDIVETADIERQLMEISELSIPVRTAINGSTPIEDCRLIIDDTGELFVQLAPGEYPDTGEIELTCALPKQIRFRSVWPFRTVRQ